MDVNFRFGWCLKDFDLLLRIFILWFAELISTAWAGSLIKNWSFFLSRVVNYSYVQSARPFITGSDKNYQFIVNNVRGGCQNAFICCAV